MNVLKGKQHCEQLQDCSAVCSEVIVMSFHYSAMSTSTTGAPSDDNGESLDVILGTTVVAFFIITSIVVAIVVILLWRKIRSKNVEISTRPLIDDPAYEEVDIVCSHHEKTSRTLDENKPSDDLAPSCSDENLNQALVGYSKVDFTKKNENGDRYVSLQGTENQAQVDTSPATGESTEIDFTTKKKKKDMHFFSPSKEDTDADDATLVDENTDISPPESPRLHESIELTREDEYGAPMIPEKSQELLNDLNGLDQQPEQGSENHYEPVNFTASGE